MSHVKPQLSLCINNTLNMSSAPPLHSVLDQEATTCRVYYMTSRYQLLDTVMYLSIPTNLPARLPSCSTSSIGRVSEVRDQSSSSLPP
jgi:hypothetical protein